jgi:hypothetical protein
VGDHFVRVLTMKEAITETRPLVLDSLLKIAANFYVVTEWMPMTVEAARKEVNNATIRLDATTAAQIDQYAAFLHVPADEVVDKALAYVFAKDRDFQEFLRSPEATRAAQSLRVRRLSPNGAANGHHPRRAKSTRAGDAASIKTVVEAGSDSRPRSRDGAA